MTTDKTFQHRRQKKSPSKMRFVMSRENERASMFRVEKKKKRKRG